MHEENVHQQRERSGWRKKLLALNFIFWPFWPFKYQYVSLRLIRRLIKPLESCWSRNGWRAGSKVGRHFVGNCKTAVGGTLYVEFPWQPKELVPEWKREWGSGGKRRTTTRRKGKNKAKKRIKIKSRGLMRQHISSFIQSAAELLLTPQHDHVLCKYLWS